MCALAFTTNASAVFSTNPYPYFCVHQDISTTSHPNPDPRTYVFGEVLNSFEACPVYNENSPLNILIENDDESVDWQDLGPTWQTYGQPISFVNGLSFTEDTHIRDAKLTDPTCRFGIIGPQ